MKENKIWDAFILSATLPADSNFNAIVVKNCPNKLNIPPTNNIPVSIHVSGRIDPSIISAIIVDAKKPTIPKQVVGTVRCRSMTYIKYHQHIHMW